METTVPAVKSLLVRARISLADASQGRYLTCDEVHLELAEATEGLRKVSGPARAHLKDCERCREYRKELRRNERALAALVPVGPLAALAHTLSSKLGLGGAKAGAGGSAGAGAGAGGAASAGAGGSTLGSAAAAGGGGGLGLAGGSAAGLGGAALGAKAVAGLASVALLTAGAVEVRHLASSEPTPKTAAVERDATAMTPTKHTMHGGSPASAPASPAPDEKTEAEPPIEPPAPETPVEPETSPPPDEPAGPAPGDTATSTPADGGEEIPTNHGDSEGVIHPPPEGPPVVDPPPVNPPPEVDPVPPDAPSSESTGSETDGYEPVAGS